MSKRKLLQLVNEGFVSGWNDPRMPTIAGMRRRGFTPESIREFCSRAGISKRENVAEFSLLEFCLREHLNKIALRRMVVFNPLKIVITNFGDHSEILDSENNPEDENGGVRKITFSKEIYIEQEDFMEVAPKKYFRLAPGQSVRLKSAYIIQCDEVVKDVNGNITQVNCSYFANSKSGSDTSGVAVKSTIHWVNAANAIPVTIKEYDRLFSVENVDAQEGDFKEYVNPNSLSTITNALAEPALLEASLQDRFQFLRKGYFCMDEDSTPTNLVFNRTVTLKDSWAKEQKK
jgi:glutaminyl-tRNA synthetase